jgi:hypothetical protein
MKSQRTQLIALACAVALSGAAFAQTSGSSPTSSTPSSTTPTTTSPSSTMPSTSPTTPTDTMPSGTTPSGVTPPPGVAGTTANSTPAGANANLGASANNQTFASLDRSHKGYLSQADVASNKYLSANFQRCDTNNDSRLSQTEVSTCMQGASTSQQ